MSGKAEVLRDRVVQPLADEVHRLLGVNCFAAARIVIRSAAVGVGAFLLVDYVTPPYPLLSVLGLVALAVILDMGRRLWVLDRDIRGQERRVEASDGATRAVWPRFRDETGLCALKAVGLWSWLPVAFLSAPHAGTGTLALHWVVDVVAYGGGGLATMLLTCEARRPPPRRESGLIPTMS